MDEPVMYKITYEFYQEGNTDGTTAETEELIVEVESIGDIEQDGVYFVLKTSTGWSVNDSDELVVNTKVLKDSAIFEKQAAVFPKLAYSSNFVHLVPLDDVFTDIATPSPSHVKNTNNKSPALIPIGNLIEWELTSADSPPFEVVCITGKAIY